MNALRDLVDAGSVARALADAGRPVGAGAAFRLQKAWPSGRLALVALFRELRANDAGGVWWTVAARPEGRVPATLRRALENGKAILLPELNAAALRFPHDSGLSRLSQVIDPRRAGERLAPWAETAAPPIVELLGYKPARRLVARYDWRDGRGQDAGGTGDMPETVSGAGHGMGQSLIGKCYRPGRDEEVLAIHAALQAVGHDGWIDGLEIPAPCGRVKEWRMLVWRPSRGRSFHDLLEDPRAPDVAQRIGGALAGLQGSDAGWERRHTADDELGVVTRWTDAATSAYPGFADEFRRASEELRRAATWIMIDDRTDVARLVPSHRDFFDKQLLVNDDQVVLLDLDTACRAEPELDPGNFLAHLRLRRLQGRRLPVESLRVAFLEGVRQGTTPCEALRVSFYEACTLIRLAAVYAFRPRGSALTGELLAAARAVISDSSQQRRSMHVV